MVTVPTYQREQSLRPANTQDISVRVNPNEFGAALGRGLQRAGAAVGDAADSLKAIQAFDDENAAKDADNAFANWARERMYGEGGYLTMQGRNAVEGRAKFDEDAEAKRKEFGADLRPGAARLYSRASQARLMSLGQQAIVHQAEQRKSWFAETSTARTTAFANDALANSSNPALVQKNIAAGLLELDNRGQLEGWSAEELARQKSTYTSGVHSGVVTTLADSSPLAADKYMQDNKDAFLPGDAHKLHTMLEAPLRTARTDQWLQNAINGLPTGSDFSTPQTGKLLGQMLPITVHSESGGNPNAVSPKGARGLMQVMPTTGADPGFGIRPSNGTAADNVRVGQEYLGKMMQRYGNDPAKAWAAYNAGPGTLDKAMQANGANWLAAMPKETQDYVRKNIAALGGKGAGGDNSSAWVSSLYRQADKIANPEDRDAAYAAVSRWYSRQQGALEASRKQVVDDLEKRMIADPSFDPKSLPISTQQVIGMSGMNSLQNWHDAKTAATKVKTDLVTFDGLLQQQAFDPAGFARVDLLPYRDKLSDSDYMELRGKQRSAIADVQKEMRSGAVYRDAFTVAKEFYGAAGIKTGNSSAARSDANKQLEAQFNGAVRNEVDTFIQREKRAPSYDEMRAIASGLTLKVVGSQTRSPWSPMRLFDNDDQADMWTGRVFQRSDMPAGLTRRINPSFSDVPPDWVGPLRQSLQKKIGRAPTNAEIATEWGKTAMSLIGR